MSIADTITLYLQMKRMEYNNRQQQKKREKCFRFALNPSNEKEGVYDDARKN